MTRRTDHNLRRTRGDGPNRAALDLRIHELVLHGFRPADRGAISAAIERELARLLAQGALPVGWADEGSRAAGAGAPLDAGEFDVPRAWHPEAVGTQVARAIHHSLTEPHPRGAAAASPPAATQSADPDRVAPIRPLAGPGAP